MERNSAKDKVPEETYSHEENNHGLQNKDQNLKDKNDSKHNGCMDTMWNFCKDIKAEPLMTLFGLGFYMPMTFVQNLMIEKVCKAKYPEEICSNKSNIEVEKEIQDIAANYLMIHYLVRQLPAVILSLYMGTWSDRYGRRQIVQISLLGNILVFILYILNSYYSEWPAEYIILSGIPGGLTGDYAAFMLGLFGYIKDETTSKTISSKISVADGLELLTSQIGPLIGGQLFYYYGYPAVFYAGMGFHILGMIYAYFRVKDAHFMSDNWKVKIRNFFRISGFLESLKEVFKKRPDNKRTYIICVLITATVIFFTYFGHSEIMYLYSRSKLHWDVFTMTRYNVTLGGCAALGTLILLPLILHYFRVSDIIFGLVGHLGFMAFYLGTAFANDTTSMFSVCAFQIIATMCFVTLRSCISKCVKCSEVGRIMSVYAVLQALSRNLGQIIATQIYVATLHSFVGAYFVVAAALFIINISVYSWVHFDMKKRNFILENQDDEITSLGNGSITTLSTFMSESKSDIVNSSII